MWCVGAFGPELQGKVTLEYTVETIGEDMPVALMSKAQGAM